MIARKSVTILVACSLAACLSHEGRYSPACVAFEGSNIELLNGQFVWEKFTDMVVVDDDGEVINQFPGYPMQGSYRIDGQTVSMESAGGESLENMYLHRSENRSYLLTTGQHKAWEETGEFAECALVLGGISEN